MYPLTGSDASTDSTMVESDTLEIISKEDVKAFSEDAKLYSLRGRAVISLIDLSET